MINSKLLDSSIWISFIIDNKNSEIIESDKLLLLSSLSIFEIKRKLIKDKVKNGDIERIIAFIKKRSSIINVDEKIAEKAAEISSEKNLPAIDALIYSTALSNNLELITLDNDFRSLPNANVI